MTGINRHRLALLVVIVAGATAGGTVLAKRAAQDEAAPTGRFATWRGGGWTVTDRGKETCNAEFAVGGETVLSFQGPYWYSPGEPNGGSMVDVGQTKYALPLKTSDEDRFPVTLAAGTVAVTLSGFATDLGARLAIAFAPEFSTIDLLEALPDRAAFTAHVAQQPILAVPLTHNRAAAQQLRACVDFATRQKRPGTRNGPALGPPELLPPPEIEVSSEPSPRSEDDPASRPPVYVEPRTR